MGLVWNGVREAEYLGDRCPLPRFSQAWGERTGLCWALPSCLMLDDLTVTLGYTTALVGRDGGSVGWAELQDCQPLPPFAHL